VALSKTKISQNPPNKETFRIGNPTRRHHPELKHEFPIESDESMLFPPREKQEAEVRESVRERNTGELKTGLSVQWARIER
jgi:hypothetical protein